MDTDKELQSAVMERREERLDAMTSKEILQLPIFQKNIRQMGLGITTLLQRLPVHDRQVLERGMLGEFNEILVAYLYLIATRIEDPQRLHIHCPETPAGRYALHRVEELFRFGIKG